MTIFQYVSIMALFLCAVVLGGIVIVLVMRQGDTLDMATLVNIAANTQDSELLDFLEKSECNLFFNGTLGAWGLLDGGDKIVATARTVRTTLARAIEKGAHLPLLARDTPPKDDSEPPANSAAPVSPPPPSGPAPISESNGLFPDTSAMDRAFGQVNMRKQETREVQHG